ncbi:hypothetical protein D3C72_1806110 [compost metagenome]
MVGLRPFAILNLPMHRHSWIKLTEHGVDPSSASDDAIITGNDGGLGQALGWDQLGGDVATADVFEQRTAYVGFDFGSQVGET